MWTVLWTSTEGKDCWERFESKEGMVAFLDDRALLDDPDVLIFPPVADEYAITPYELDSYEPGY